MRDVLAVAAAWIPYSTPTRDERSETHRHPVVEVHINGRKDIQNESFPERVRIHLPIDGGESQNRLMVRVAGFYRIYIVAFVKCTDGLP